ncbi:MAG: 2-dehydro-3-deoxygalactonokinase [Ruminococcaceae bacterium]|nr:2-dehydro-3-deoxygalactonokinase [Oscillospiraceae bacterium]
MSSYIVIDGGTTTTRVALISNKKLIDKIKISAGARANMQAPGTLEAAVREAIDRLLSQNSAAPECILAAGMITGEFGLYNLPHIEAPAGIDDLGNSVAEVRLPDISPLPFYFIPGVKILGDIEKTDMMRGEECEVFGLYDGEDAVFVLPGSHSKIINLKDGKITDFKTLLTGEMTASLCEGTILRDAVDLSASLEESYLIGGYRYCREHGINEALFKVRILKNLLSASRDEIYSFFLGVVLCGEIEAIIKTHKKNIFVAGRAELRAATAILLKSEGLNATPVSDEAADMSTFLGMIKIFESKKSKD